MHAPPARETAASRPPGTGPVAAGEAAGGAAAMGSQTGGRGMGAPRLSPISLLNYAAALAPHRVEDGLAYGPGPSHRLDLFLPPVAERPAPLIVFFHGGGWDSGWHRDYRFVGIALAAEGFAVAVPGYRVYPEVRFPDFLADAAAAVAWMRREAPRFGVDPGRIVVAGHSAGAHIAAMLAFDRFWLADAGVEPSRDIAGLVGLAGPYDFLPLRTSRLAAIFGAMPERGQPIAFVHPGAPPAFLAAGLNDTTVDPGNTTRLAARIREVGGSVATALYGHAGHATILAALWRPLAFLAPTLRDVTDFARHARSAAATARDLPPLAGAGPAQHPSRA
jgi:acetyl esterase/lipase